MLPARRLLASIQNVARDSKVKPTEAKLYVFRARADGGEDGGAARSQTEEQFGENCAEAEQERTAGAGAGADAGAFMISASGGDGGSHPSEKREESSFPQCGEGTHSREGAEKKEGNVLACPAIWCFAGPFTSPADLQKHIKGKRHVARESLEKKWEEQCRTCEESFHCGSSF